MGGKNPFLGWAYIVVGIVCMIAFVVFFALHKTWKMVRFIEYSSRSEEKYVTRSWTEIIIVKDSLCFLRKN